MEENKKKRTKEETAKVEKTFEIIDKLIDRKLSDLKVFATFVFSIFTAVFVYIMVNVKISTQNVWFWVIILIAVIVCMLSVIFVLFVHLDYYYEQEDYYKIKKFCPCVLKSYYKSSEEDFIANLQKYLDVGLTETERLQAISIKVKINEFRYKKKLANIVLGVLLFGFIFLMILIGIMPEYVG